MFFCRENSKNPSNVATCHLGALPMAPLLKQVRPTHNAGYDTNRSDGEVAVMLEFWGMRSSLSLPILPGSLCPGVVAPDKGLINGLNLTKPRLLYFAFFAFKLRIYAKLNCLR